MCAETIKLRSQLLCLLAGRFAEPSATGSCYRLTRFTSRSTFRRPCHWPSFLQQHCPHHASQNKPPYCSCRSTTLPDFMTESSDSRWTASFALSAGLRMRPYRFALSASSIQVSARQCQYCFMSQRSYDRPIATIMRVGRIVRTWLRFGSCLRCAMLV